MKNPFNCFLLLMFVISAPGVLAQEHIEKLTHDERVQVVESVSKLLLDNYVFPEVAEEIVQRINQGLENHYKSYDWPQEFAECLTEDLRSVNNDKHLGVLFEPNAGTAQSSSGNPPSFANYLESQKRANYGFQELKIMDGNVGYLNLKGFVNADYAKETAVAAMGFLANTDAIIIDLRENGGGSPTMIQLLSSYFFEGEPLHLNTFYNRPNDQTFETWTLADVPGQRMPETDLYILTSNATFSAAEEFAYNLRNLNRATLIGEKTGGAAHPVNKMMVASRFSISLPTGRAINPITQTNWEGVGVEPHLQVEKGEALATAHIQALEALAGKASDEHKKLYEWHLANYKAQEQPIALETSQLAKYVGVYGPRKITEEGGRLYYQREGRPKFELIPMESDLFRIKELPDFRVKFRTDNQQVKAMTGLYLNGNEDTFLKEN